MCQEHIKYGMQRDGRLKTERELELCSRSLDNRPCEDFKPYYDKESSPEPPDFYQRAARLSPNYYRRSSIKLENPDFSVTERRRSEAERRQRKLEKETMRIQQEQEQRLNARMTQRRNVAFYYPELNSRPTRNSSLREGVNDDDAQNEPRTIGTVLIDPKHSYKTDSELSGSEIGISTDPRERVQQSGQHTPIMNTADWTQGKSFDTPHDVSRQETARFDIPPVRNLQNIDDLISQSTDDKEIEELKQQKRLLRNRQAALESRETKKLHAEHFEEAKKQHNTVVGALEGDMSGLDVETAQLHLANELLQKRVDAHHATPQKPNAAQNADNEQDCQAPWSQKSENDSHLAATPSGQLDGQKNAPVAEESRLSDHGEPVPDIASYSHTDEDLSSGSRPQQMEPDDTDEGEYSVESCLAMLSAPSDPEFWQGLLQIGEVLREQSTDHSIEDRNHIPYPTRTTRHCHSFEKQPSLPLPRSITSESTTGEWHVDGVINGLLIRALADTGANINAISTSEADRLGLVPVLENGSRPIRLPSGKTCRSRGVASLNFNFDGEEKIHALQCNIVDNLEYGMIVCYDFLQKTETLTRHFKQRIKEVARSCLRKFPLCLLEDDSMPAQTRARMDGFINGTSARVVPDTGSGIMAISAAFARRLGLAIDTTRRTEVTFADSSSAPTLGTVKAVWNFIPPDQTELRTCLDDGGQAADESGSKRVISFPHDTGADEPESEGDGWDYDWEYEWHVIEDLPADAILSIAFIKKHDVFGRHQHAFVHEPLELSPPEILGICELPGGNKELRTLAEQFVSDLNSPDPFNYDMVLRESIRQSEIQRRILELPPEAHVTQLQIEQARIESWDRIKVTRESGEDWCRMRSEYLHSLRLRPSQLSWAQSPTDTQGPICRGNSRWRGRFWRKRWRGGS